MESRETYNQSVKYEIFLRRAFKFDARLSDPSNREILNLIDAENGNRPKFLPTKEKQFEEIRKRMLKAITILLERATSEEKRKLQSLLPQLEAAYSSNDVINIVELGLEYSQSFK